MSFKRSGKEMIRVVIADDHALFRAGVRSILDAVGQARIVGEADDAGSVIETVRCNQPDLLLCDLTMPGATGTDLIERLRKHFPALPILVLSMHDEPALVRRSIEAGASGYLTKESSLELLSEAISKVARGGKFVPAELATRVVLDTGNGRGPEAHLTLSKREREIFELIYKGVSLAQIASLLGISPKTITTHKAHLMEKLDVQNNAELIRYAADHEIFENK